MLRTLFLTSYLLLLTSKSGDIMFGYVKAYKPYMRVCEFEFFKSVYCGLCKRLYAVGGAAAAATLSYDFVFLTLFRLGTDKTDMRVKKCRCPFHPLHGVSCIEAENSEAFEYSADAACILTYHKLRDDIYDKGFKKKAAALALLPFFVRPYRQASKRRGQLSQAVSKAMKAQRALERERACSLDLAAQPTAEIMRAVFRCAAGLDPDERERFGRFGYMLGRYVYICDALDDIFEDLRLGGYNPLLNGKKTLNREEYKKIASYAGQSINFTLGALSAAYSEIELNGTQSVADNIVYLGLRDAFKRVVLKGLKRFNDNKREDK